MTYKINPSIYFIDTDTRSWNDAYPTWISRSDDIKNNSFLVPDHRKNIAVVKKDNSIKCISNICTHKQSLLLNGHGTLNNVIVCPIHKWTWNTNGQIKTSKGITQCENMNLNSYRHTEWNGHLFVGPTTWLNDIENLGSELTSFLDISKYRWHSRHTIEYNFDWKIFYEIFLDLYHVQTFHPGLRSLTDCKTFDWKFGEHWSCQTALFNKSIPHEKNYAELYELYKRTGYYETAKYGAIWLGIYPNIMLEYYPGCFVVSTIWPNGPGKCVNHLEFYYEEGLIDKEPTFPIVQQNSFMNTANEDEEIGNLISAGRKLINSSLEFINHPIEEAGTQHFYNWLHTYYDIGQITK